MKACDHDRTGGGLRAKALTLALTLTACTPLHYPSGVSSSADLAALFDVSSSPADQLVHLSRARCFSVDGATSSDSLDEDLKVASTALDMTLDAAVRDVDFAALTSLGETLAAGFATLRQEAASNDAKRFLESCEPAQRQLDRAISKASDAQSAARDRQAAFDDIATTYDPEALESFLADYPHHPMREVAVQRLLGVRADRQRGRAAVAAVAERGPAACDQVRRWLQTSLFPESAEFAADTVAVCNAHEELVTSLQEWEGAPLTGDAMDPMWTLHDLGTRTNDPDLHDRLDAEIRRRWRHRFGCQPLREPTTVTMEREDVAFVMLLGASSEPVAQGFAPTGATYTRLAQCDEPDDGSVLARWGEHLAIVRQHSSQGTDAVAEGWLRDAAQRTDPCTLMPLSYGREGTVTEMPWTSGQHTLTARRRGSELLVEVNLVTDSDGRLEAGIANIFAAELGLRAQTSPRSAHDKLLREVALCLAHRVSEWFANPTPPRVPDERPLAQHLPPGVVLYRDAMAPERMLAAFERATEPPSTLTLDLTLSLSTELIDAYGRRTAGEPKRLRRGRMVLSGVRLLRNDWGSIATLAEEAGGVFEEARSAAVVRRYVDKWSTW